MRTFAEKPKTTQQDTSVKAPPLSGAPVGHDHDPDSILRLERIIGHPVPRSLGSNSEGPNVALSGTASDAVQHDFSRISIRPLTTGALQTKLAISQPADEYEQEADRIADQVMRMPDSQVQGACPCGGGCPKCQPQGPAHARQGVQTKHVESGALALTEAPPSIFDALRSPGQPLDPATRNFMEPRFEHDFSGVRVYSNETAARSARDVSAKAYTVGNHIVFGAGQLDPSSTPGRRLLAHELSHVIQQGGGARLSLQRDELKGEAKVKDASKQAAPARPEPGTAYFHIVVRDKALDLGGGLLVSDLADAKTKLMKRKIDKPWTLVLAIHASENRLGAQSPPDWQKNAIFYDESDVKKIFGGDSAFVAWRNQFGPNRVVLYGCQVTAAFEQTIADNLARGGKAPSATGLGEGCKPLATTITFGVKSRREYDKLVDTEKEKMLRELQAANQTWGYYGGPPVPGDDVLDYLFNGPSPGEWPQVEVIVKQGDKYVPTKPPIPYWNRFSNSMYLRQCTKAVGNLRQHTPRVPTVGDSE